MPWYTKENDLAEENMKLGERYLDKVVSTYDVTAVKCCIVCVRSQV